MPNPYLRAALAEQQEKRKSLKISARKTPAKKAAQPDSGDSDTVESE